MLQELKKEPYETSNMEALSSLQAAREFNRRGEFSQAEMICKAVAFDALYSSDLDLLRHSYFLLAEFSDDEETEFRFLQGALQASEFSGPLYVRTCFLLVYRMHAMDTPKVLRLAKILMVTVQNNEFLAFLVALHAKLTNQDYSTLYIPNELVLELSKFKYKESKGAI